MSEIYNDVGGLPLFDEVPAPPTGPQVDDFGYDEGLPPAFARFLATEDGQAFWRAIQEAALAVFRRGETRFSPRGFLAHYRDTNKVRINNIFSPWFADMLVAAHPELLDIVERRKRKKPGPFV